MVKHVLKEKLQQRTNVARFRFQKSRIFVFNFIHIFKSIYALKNLYPSNLYLHIEREKEVHPLMNIGK